MKRMYRGPTNHPWRTPYPGRETARTHAVRSVDRQVRFLLAAGVPPGSRSAKGIPFWFMRARGVPLWFMRATGVPWPRGFAWLALLAAGGLVVSQAGCDDDEDVLPGGIRASVVDTLGAPVVSALVWVESMPDRVVSADVTGTAVLGDIPAGDHVIWGEILPPAFVGVPLLGSRSVTVSAGKLTEVVLNLLPGNPRRPRALILEPSGVVYSAADSIHFAGRAGDLQDDSDDLEVTWTSSVDGVLHEGQADSIGLTEFRGRLSAGAHRITLRVEDSEGLSGLHQKDLDVR